MIVFGVALSAQQLETGKQIFESACISCHGADGKGAPRSSVGFENELPDFTQCSFSTKEASSDWSAIIHNGGPARGFSRIMPSFREALTDDQIDKVVGYLKGFCTERGWPQGELNLPRAMFTEKAFPENETVITGAINTHSPSAVSTQVIYEQRFGAKNQIEVIAPVAFNQRETGTWVGGIGDMGFGYKRLLASSMRTGSIVSVGGEITAPTGNVAKDTGGGVTVFEVFGAYGQMLPWDSFVQLQSGVELPRDTAKAARAYYFRTAVGRSLTSGGGLGRAWTPMAEFIADRDWVKGAKTNWDVIPQLQIPLSKRMHILGSVGVRVPMNNRDDRHAQVMFYLLWDWADGSLKAGW